jgi:hypothetical protein
LEDFPTVTREQATILILNREGAEARGT